MARKSASKVTENTASEVKATTKTKKPATKTTTKTTTTKTKKVEEVKPVENVKKVSVSMDEVMKELIDAGIKVMNPDAKGKYRIFGSKKGSSLNVQTKQFIIYSTDEDYKAVEEAKIEGVELTEKGNSQDKVRPNVVRIPSFEVLRMVLPVYAKNSANAIN